MPRSGELLTGMSQQTNGPDFWPLCETTKILYAYLVLNWASWFNKSATWLLTTRRLRKDVKPRLKISIVFVSHLIVTLLPAHLIFGQYDVIRCDCSFIVYLHLPQCLYDMLCLLVFSFFFLISACFCLPLLSSIRFNSFYFRIVYASCCSFQSFCDPVHMFSSLQSSLQTQFLFIVCYFFGGAFQLQGIV